MVLHAQQTTRAISDVARVSAAGRVSGADEEESAGSGVMPPASYCSHCHGQTYAEWRQALHSNSFRTPFFRVDEDLLSSAKGARFTRHCDGCHYPISLDAEAGNAEAAGVHEPGGDGVTCMICHSIQRVSSKMGNGSYVMAVPAVIVDAEGNRVPGEVPEDEIMRFPERHKRAVMQDSYRTPEFCGACHQASLPVSLTGDRVIREFATYDEWQMSSFSGRNPLNFYPTKEATCQDCHMPREPVAEGDYGSNHGALISHRWLAGNTAVPFLYGYANQLEKTEKFLRSGSYLRVDLFGVKAGGSDKLIAPLGSVPFRLSAGNDLEVFVVIQNRGIGHSLLPEIRDLYEAWIEFEAQDASGRELYHSGFIKPDGTVDEYAHAFVNRPIDKGGNFVDNHEVWNERSPGYDSTIPAGGSVLVRYRFTIPADAAGPIALTVKVNYRHFRQGYLNAVLRPDHPRYPVVELASATRKLSIGGNLPSSPKPGENPDWMRWNNLGIACLSLGTGSGFGPVPAEEYAQAISAFMHVVQLRPRYADGYTNLALTYLQMGILDDAAHELETALSLSPWNSRALYYRGLLEERTIRDAQAMADLRAVVARFPQCRDARRELGTVELKERQYDDARRQFQALQQIDPDDLSAHFNLAVLYRRLGMSAEASREESLYEAEKPNPAAPTYSLEYLRKHPEMEREMLPWHVHSDHQPGSTTVQADGK
jgi:tetratricopeptide (TPR) repeat protein